MVDENTINVAAGWIYSTITQHELFLLTLIIVIIIAIIISKSISKWGELYMKQDPRTRPNLLNFIIVLILITAIIILGITKNIDSQAITTLIGAIAGYIFGVTTDPKIFRGLETPKPVATIGPVKSEVKANEHIILDGSGSKGDTLTYKWTIVLAPTNSNVTISNPTDVKPGFTQDLEGKYMIQLIVNDGIQDSDPANVVIDVKS